MSTYFSKDHEWVKVDGDVAIMGITAHAAEQLGEIVFVELKDVGDSVEKGEEMGVVESVKAASEFYAPVSGEIMAANDAVVETPKAINEGPEGDGWLYKLKLSNASELDELMDVDAYKATLD